jgi:hypothetical protein
MMTQQAMAKEMKAQGKTTAEIAEALGVTFIMALTLSRSDTDRWANFLLNEKLEPKNLPDEQDTLDLIDLAEACGKERSPSIREHKLKLESREFLVAKAMDLGIDLPAMKNKRGRVAMGRGLLNAWNKVYAKKYGSTVGTASAFEARRRDVKTKLCNEGIHGVKRS